MSQSSFLLLYCIKPTTLFWKINFSWLQHSDFKFFSLRRSHLFCSVSWNSWEAFSKCLCIIIYIHWNPLNLQNDITVKFIIIFHSSSQFPFSIYQSRDYLLFADGHSAGLHLYFLEVSCRFWEVHIHNLMNVMTCLISRHCSECKKMQRR